MSFLHLCGVNTLGSQQGTLESTFPSHQQLIQRVNLPSDYLRSILVDLKKQNKTLFQVAILCLL